MRHVVHITKALADPGRLRILCALRDGELCVCQIHELLGLATSTVSRHLSLLAMAQLVEMRKEGRWAYYRLPGRDAPREVRRSVDWVLESLRHDPVIEADDARRRAILQLTPEQLCGLQAKGIKCCSSAPAIRAGARWPKDGRAPSKAT